MTHSPDVNFVSIKPLMMLEPIKMSNVVYFPVSPIDEIDKTITFLC